MGPVRILLLLIRGVLLSKRPRLQKRDRLFWAILSVLSARTFWSFVREFSPPPPARIQIQAWAD